MTSHLLEKGNRGPESLGELVSQDGNRPQIPATLVGQGAPAKPRRVKQLRGLVLVSVPKVGTELVSVFALRGGVLGSQVTSHVDM